MPAKEEKEKQKLCVRFVSRLKERIRRVDVQRAMFIGKTFMGVVLSVVTLLVSLNVINMG